MYRKLNPKLAHSVYNSLLYIGQNTACQNYFNKGGCFICSLQRDCTWEETNKSGSELQVYTSAQVIIVLSPTRIPYMVIVYIHIWYLLIVSHI